MNDTRDWSDPVIREYVEQVHEEAAQGVLREQRALVNWLFAVNAGGIVGLLTHAAAKGSHITLAYALSIFFLGVVFIMLYRTIMYYWLARRYRAFAAETQKLAAGKVSFSEFVSYSSGTV